KAGSARAKSRATRARSPFRSPYRGNSRSDGTRIARPRAQSTPLRSPREPGSGPALLRGRCQSPLRPALAINADASHRYRRAWGNVSVRHKVHIQRVEIERLAEMQLVDHLGDVEGEGHAFAAVFPFRGARLTQAEQPD